MSNVKVDKVQFAAFLREIYVLDRGERDVKFRAYKVDKERSGEIRRFFESGEKVLVTVELLEDDSVIEWRDD